MGLFSLILPATDPSFASVCACLAALGFSGGLFIVPLNALIQQRPAAHEKGQLLATNNFLNSFGIILASGVLWLFHTRLGWSAETIIFAFGVFTLIVNTYVLFLLPDFLIRFSLWMLTHTLYRIRIVGQEHVPFRGPALLVCNHVSHVDGLLVGACVQRFIRFMVYRPYYEMPLLNPLMRLMNAIPVAGGNRQEVIESLERAREELKNGHVVCIFAEGAISRTGQPAALQTRLRAHRRRPRRAGDSGAPRSPVGQHLQLQASGRFFWKRPERIPYPVTVAFGKPMPSTVKAAAARQAIQELGAEAMGLALRPARRAARALRARGEAPLGPLLHGRFQRQGADLRPHADRLAGAVTLDSRALRRREDGRPDAAGVDRRRARQSRGHAAGPRAGEPEFHRGKRVDREGDRAVRHQDHPHLARLPDQSEDRGTPRHGLPRRRAEKTPKAQQIVTAAIAWLLPARLLLRVYRPEQSKADDLATVIFSSGSTGTPKGVMLSHRNILTNVEGIGQVYWVTGERPRARRAAVLPFVRLHRHALAAAAPRLRRRLSPESDGRGATIGELVEKYKVDAADHDADVLRRVSAEVHARAVREPAVHGGRRGKAARGAGARLQGEIRRRAARRLRLHRNVAGRGGQRAGRRRPGQRGTKAGTVGHPLPGVVARVVDPDTGAPLDPDQPGLLLVKGGNRMLGYLKQPELDREVIRDGWYVTGDIASIDEDGFITITDRLSRFSKIGGEMVPHLKIEEAISRFLDDQGCIVTAAPDERRARSWSRSTRRRTSRRRNCGRS